MKKWMFAIYVVVAAIALCIVVMLTQHDDAPEPSEPSMAPTTTAPTEPAYIGEVRLYQCDPDLAENWAAIAAAYTAETGIPVTILTPESGYCEGQLSQYMQGDQAATIFCLHHSRDAELWKDYCLDLTGTQIAEELSQDIFALHSGDAIVGVAGNVESYGIIYNNQLLARAGFTESDITDFEALQDIVKNITANKKSLGFSAFASPDLQDTAHGALLCLLAGLSQEDTVLRSFWDLYISNCVRSGASLTQADSDDALQDFLNGKAVFYLGGTWDYEDFTKIKDYNLGILPVYTTENQANLGLHHASTSYWSVNAKVSQLDQAVSLDFLHWLVTAKEDAPAPADALQLLLPYKDTQYAGNPLEQLVLESMLQDAASVQWNSCDNLSPELLEKLGDALAAYAKQPSDEAWAAVTQLKQNS